MGYQSAALAYNFGLNYEFGKRVIKSMSNEKFNKIADDPILLNELTSRHHDVLLKAFINEVPKVDRIQDLIIKKMVELEFAKIKVMPELIAQIPKGFIEGIFELGGGKSTSTQTEQQDDTSSGGSSGKGKSETFTDSEEKKKTQSDTTGIQNFAQIPSYAQKDVFNHIKEMYRWNKSMIGVSKAVQQVFLSRAKQNGNKWRALYIKVGGYKNPTPYETFVANGQFQLDNRIGSILRDWHKVL